MSKTKDEQLILMAYKEAEKRGDMRAYLNRYEIGKLIGISPKATDTICVLLAQANFIKKVDAKTFYLTPNGIELALRLLDE